MPNNNCERNKKPIIMYVTIVENLLCKNRTKTAMLEVHMRHEDGTFDHTDANETVDENFVIFNF